RQHGSGRKHRAHADVLEDRRQGAAGARQLARVANRRVDWSNVDDRAKGVAAERTCGSSTRSRSWKRESHSYESATLLPDPGAHSVRRSSSEAIEVILTWRQ